MPLLTLHDRFSLAHEIERHIEFASNGDGAKTRSVALPPVFIDHFMAYRDSTLPRVGAVVTAPLVLPDGSLLASQGLDAGRKLVFRIEPELLRLLPKSSEPYPDRNRVAGALNFLVSDWLCDVATDFVGRCVLIALALSVLERVLLPERPAFFVTAGKRGGGKTTALAMVILAVTGKKPAAAAWSSSEEERRKALAAYLSEGLAAMVFDNIPLGTTISCPTIEKILTAEIYSDRILGKTATATVPAYTILTFTGNNIAPKGDLASRSLVTRLYIDQADPENRSFRHADPIAWTVNNRGKILRALYVLLLGNPHLRAPAPQKTRFKRWWGLVGSAVEHAADCLNAVPIDFGAIFAGVEGQDDESTSLLEALDVLRSIIGDRFFKAADVARLINGPIEGEADQARQLREYFQSSSGRRSSGEVSSMVIGVRLGMIVDAPVFDGERTLRLVRDQPENQAKLRKTGMFQVRVA